MMVLFEALPRHLMLGTLLRWVTRLVAKRAFADEGTPQHMIGTSTDEVIVVRNVRRAVLLIFLQNGGRSTTVLVFMCLVRAVRLTVAIAESVLMLVMIGICLFVVLVHILTISWHLLGESAGNLLAAFAAIRLRTFVLIN